MSSLAFYRKFEDRHRGSRELIKARLQQYTPFLDALLNSFENCKALDIGCGRGEWLELLTEKKITVQGVDLDAGMLSACLDRGFNVQQADGISFLEMHESNSLHLISAFHVVEHINFEQLQALVNNAYRVLAPGGLLILETPNPENIVVASANFYLDPTHIKPIPPLLLSFVTDFAGFDYNKVVRLQEPIDLKDKQNISVSDLLFGVSPDYAVVAQKPIDSASKIQMGTVFEQSYGISLSDLSLRLDNRLLVIESKLKEVEVKASEADVKANFANIELQRIALEANHYHNLCEAVVGSNSWRLTYPLRQFGKVARWLVYGSYHWFTFSQTSRPRRVLKALFINLKRKINNRPVLKQKVMQCLSFLPSLQNRLRQVGNFVAVDAKNNTEKLRQENSYSIAQMSPRAKKIYFQLKDAIEQRKISK